MVAVPLLGYCGIEPKSTHATSVAVILPLSIASGLLYYTKGSLDFMQALPYLPGGILGALLGGWLMPKIKVTWLKRVFGLLILYSALRILMQ